RIVGETGERRRVHERLVDERDQVAKRSSEAVGAPEIEPQADAPGAEEQDDDGPDRVRCPGLGRRGESEQPTAHHDQRQPDVVVLSLTGQLDLAERLLDEGRLHSTPLPSNARGMPTGSDAGSMPGEAGERLDADQGRRTSMIALSPPSVKTRSPAAVK